MLGGVADFPRCVGLSTCVKIINILDGGSVVVEIAFKSDSRPLVLPIFATSLLDIVSLWSALAAQRVDHCESDNVGKRGQYERSLASEAPRLVGGHRALRRPQPFD